MSTQYCDNLHFATCWRELTAYKLDKIIYVVRRVLTSFVCFGGHSYIDTNILLGTAKLKNESMPSSHWRKRLPL